MMMLNNLFKDSKLTLISNSSSVEYDDTFQSYLSYSFDENTIIFTDNVSLLRNKEKYKEIYQLYSWSDIFPYLKNIENKTVFIDIYLNNIIVSYNEDSYSYRYSYIKNEIIDKLIYLTSFNNLNVVLISQNDSVTNSTNTIINGTYLSIVPSCDLWIEYNTEFQDILIKKSRWYESGIYLNLRKWKLNLRNNKIKRLLNNFN